MGDDRSTELQRARALREESDRYIRATLACLTSAEIEAHRPGHTATLTASEYVLQLPQPAGGLPVFQFDHNLDVLPIVAEINQMLGAASEPTATASWWATPHAKLDGHAPYALAGKPEAAGRLRRAVEASLSIDY